MPIYEYVCEDCNTEFEKLVFSKDESVTCKKCNSSKVRKRMSICAFKSGEGKFVGTTSSSCSGCSASSCSTCGK